MSVSEKCCNKHKSDKPLTSRRTDRGKKITGLKSTQYNFCSLSDVPLLKQDLSHIYTEIPSKYHLARTYPEKRYECLIFSFSIKVHYLYYSSFQFLFSRARGNYIYEYTLGETFFYFPSSSNSKNTPIFVSVQL